MKKLAFFLIPLLVILAVSGWTTVDAAQQAQSAAIPAADADLDAILARAAVKGYLNSLRYSQNTRASMASFYLTDEALQSDVAQKLATGQADGYEIAGEDWLNTDTYRVTALFSTADQVVVADVNKVGNRWKIVSLAWGDSALIPAAEGTAGDSSVAGTSVTAEVLTTAVNVRTGPGLSYPSQTVLEKGDTVDVTGVSGLGTWYQVAQDGSPLGWISASPQYVTASGSTADVPVVAAPGIPSGGGKLILQTSSGGDFYLLNADLSPFADGSQLRYLTSGIDPAFSPDGTKVAFTRWAGNNGTGSVWIYNLDSGQEQHVIGGIDYQPKAPTWSPDGSQLVISFQHGGRREAEHVCGEPGKIQIPPGAIDINIGSDTGRICFTLPVHTEWKLRKITIADGSYVDVASDTYAYTPAWDPANNWRVIYAGSSGLQQLDLNRNEYFAFTKDFRDRGPVFSPDGSQVAVSYKQHLNWEVYTIDAKTGDRTRLTAPSFLEDAYNSASPAWSPNGQKIAFVTDRTGQWEFWIMNADGSGPRPLLSPDLAAQIPVVYREVDERLISWGK